MKCEKQYNSVYMRFERRLCPPFYYLTENRIKDIQTSLMYADANGYSEYVAALASIPGATLWNLILGSSTEVGIRLNLSHGVLKLGSLTKLSHFDCKIASKLDEEK